MRGWSFPAGRLFGVDIRIHVTFLFLLGFVWFSESLNMGVSGPGRGLALVFIIFGCVVLHELAHAVVAKRSGIAVRSIILLPIGGVTLMEDLGLGVRGVKRQAGEPGDRGGYWRSHPCLRPSS